MLLCALLAPPERFRRGSARHPRRGHRYRHARRPRSLRAGQHKAFKLETRARRARRRAFSLMRDRMPDAAGAITAVRSGKLPRNGCAWCSK
jgi:hypothetical protein